MEAFSLYGWLDCITQTVNNIYSDIFSFLDTFIFGYFLSAVCGSVPQPPVTAGAVSAATVVVTVLFGGLFTK